MDSTGGAERALRPVGWLVVAAVGAIMLTQATGWAGTRSVAVLQSLTPYGIVVLAIVAVVAVVRREYRVGFAAAAIGFSGVLLAAPLVFGPAQPPGDDAASGVRVASVNLLYGNETIGDAADALLARQPDIIVFSEYTAEHQRALTSHPLSAQYRYRVDRAGLRAGGLAIWSRYAIDEHPRLSTVNYSIDATIDGPDGPFEIVGIHPPAPVYDFDAWRHDLGLLRDRARAATSPTLLIGDLNASYWHPPFRRLLDTGFVDAHMAHGKGFSNSWPTGERRVPFVRLDHTLTGQGLVSTSVVDFDVPGSDHRGFVVTVAPAG